MSGEFHGQLEERATDADTAPAGDGPRVVLAEEILSRIGAHAREAFPRECCGILTGAYGERALISLALPAENEDRGRAHDRYRIDPSAILRADRLAQQRGEEVVGFYHSHPGHPAAPSATDVEHAWPGYIYLIAAVDGAGDPVVRAWCYDERLGRFRERPIVVSSRPDPAGAAGPQTTTGR